MLKMWQLAFYTKTFNSIWYNTTTLSIFSVLIFIKLFLQYKVQNYRKKNTLWKHPVLYLYSHIPQLLSFPIDEVQLHWLLAILKIFFWPGDLELWPMTLTFKCDLCILPLDLLAKIQVCISVCLASRAVRHTHTHTHTMSKLLHPSLTRV